MPQAATLAPAGAVTSRDGTLIAYERTGSGPALILVDGALCSRELGPMQEIAKELAARFTVYRYDRRGRGESGASSMEVGRELEDLAALIEVAGGSAHLFGISSGALLALEAANHGLKVNKLALFEPPFIVDGSRAPLPADFLPTMEASLAQGRPQVAVKMFLGFVGMPAFFLWILRLTPSWPKMLRVAPTLPHDLALVAPFQQGKPLPRDRWARATVPTLVLDGGKSPAWLRNGARALAAVLPQARYQSLAGQTHMVKAAVLAPVLAGFLADQDGGF